MVELDINVGSGIIATPFTTLNTGWFSANIIKKHVVDLDGNDLEARWLYSML